MQSEASYLDESQLAFDAPPRESTTAKAVPMRRLHRRDDDDDDDDDDDGDFGDVDEEERSVEDRYRKQLQFFTWLLTALGFLFCACRRCRRCVYGDELREWKRQKRRQRRRRLRVLRRRRRRERRRRRARERGEKVPQDEHGGDEDVRTLRSERDSTEYDVRMHKRLVFRRKVVFAIRGLYTAILFVLILLRVARHSFTTHHNTIEYVVAPVSQVTPLLCLVVGAILVQLRRVPQRTISSLYRMPAVFFGNDSTARSKRKHRPSYVPKHSDVLFSKLHTTNRRYVRQLLRTHLHAFLLLAFAPWLVVSIERFRALFHDERSSFEDESVDPWLYDRLGGLYTLTLMVLDFYVIAIPVLAFTTVSLMYHIFRQQIKYLLADMFQLNTTVTRVRSAQRRLRQRRFDGPASAVEAPRSKRTLSHVATELDRMSTEQLETQSNGWKVVLLALHHNWRLKVPLLRQDLAGEAHLVTRKPVAYLVIILTMWLGLDVSLWVSTDGDYPPVSYFAVPVAFLMVLAVFSAIADKVYRYRLLLVQQFFALAGNLELALGNSERMVVPKREAPAPSSGHVGSTHTMHLAPPPGSFEPTSLSNAGTPNLEFLDRWVEDEHADYHVETSSDSDSLDASPSRVQGSLAMAGLTFESGELELHDDPEATEEQRRLLHVIQARERFNMLPEVDPKFFLAETHFDDDEMSDDESVGSDGPAAGSAGDDLQAPLLDGPARRLKQREASVFQTQARGGPASSSTYTLPAHSFEDSSVQEMLSMETQTLRPLLDVVYSVAFPDEVVSDSAAIHPETFKFYGTGRLKLGQVWRVHRTLIKRVFVAVLITALLSLFRLVVQFPSCSQQSASLKDDENTCSTTVEWVRYVESSAVASVPFSLLPYGLLLVMLGRERVRPLFKPALAFAFACAVYKMAMFIAVGDRWYIRVGHIAMVLVFLIVAAIRAAQLIGHPRFAWIFIGCALLILIAYGTLATVLIELFDTENRDLQAVVLLVFHPVVSTTCQVLVRMLSDRLVAMPGVRNAHLYYLLVQILFTTLGRLFLVNIDNLGVQAVVVLIYAVVKIAVRSSVGVRIYVWWYAVTGSRRTAFSRAERSRVSQLNAHNIYMRMYVELFSIVYAFAFTWVAGLIYDLDVASARQIAASLAIQLVGQIISDLLAIKVEESYIERNLLRLWEHSKMYSRLLLTMSVSVIYIALNEYVRIIIIHRRE